MNTFQEVEYIQNRSFIIDFLVRERNIMSKLEDGNLQEIRNALVKEISLLSFEQFNMRSELNMWSIAQVCHHLVLVEKATVKALAWGLKQTESNETERKNIHLILDRTKKRAAPKIVEPNQNSFEIEEMLHLLNNSRKELIGFLNDIEDKYMLIEKSVNHPAFGQLPLDQWVELIPLHEQRHIEQIKEIKQVLGF